MTDDTRRLQADKLRAVADWFVDCKTLTLERLPTSLIAALKAGADALEAAAVTPEGKELDAIRQAIIRAESPTGDTSDVLDLVAVFIDHHKEVEAERNALRTAAAVTPEGRLDQDKLL